MMPPEDNREARSTLIRLGTSVVIALLSLAVARLYQTIDHQDEVLGTLREKDIAITGQLAVIEARLNGIDSAMMVRLDGTNTRLTGIEQRLDRVQHTLEQLQTSLYARPGVTPPATPPRSFP